MLKDALNFLFVPSEERITAITNSVKSKFEFVESIKIAINSLKDLLNGTAAAPTVTVPVKSTKYTSAGTVSVVDLSWYAPFKSYGDVVITGFVYLFFLWRLFRHVPDLILGKASIDDDVDYIMKH